MIPILDLKAQYESIKDEIDAAIAEVLESTQFILGPAVRDLEQRVAAYCGCKYGVGVASGTDALRLTLTALGIGPGDEVITTPFTFIATANTISHCGARPVFVDIDSRTYNLRQGDGVIGRQGDGVIGRQGAKTVFSLSPCPPLTLSQNGQPADMDPIMELTEAHGLYVIEDAAQAIGARYPSLRPGSVQATGSGRRKGRQVGSMGHAGCLSFYPTKNLGAYGDGGMVVTNPVEYESFRRVGPIEQLFHRAGRFASDHALRVTRCLPRLSPVYHSGSATGCPGCLSKGTRHWHNDLLPGSPAPPETLCQPELWKGQPAGERGSQPGSALPAHVSRTYGGTAGRNRQRYRRILR